MLTIFYYFLYYHDIILFYLILTHHLDWGFKIICYGIIDEPTDEDKEKYGKNQADIARNLSLSCWLLESLLSHSSAIDDLLLTTPSTWVVLRRYLEVTDIDRQAGVLSLLTCMLRGLRTRLTSWAGAKNRTLEQVEMLNISLRAIGA